MDFDKHEIWLLVGASVLLVSSWYLFSNKQEIGTQEYVWDTASADTPILPTGTVRKYHPLSHDFMWCEAMNDDVSYTGLHHFGRHLPGGY